ncbi:MAG: ABC transporter permease [Flavobacteriaceae bacterium]|nr:ABC transporter permease [Flavobacteriaceae bacterium]
MINLEAIDIKNFLPHREPFLMVDKVLELSEDFVVTSFYIKSTCILIEDNNFNEVGLIENAAQTCSSIVGKSYFDDDDIEGKGTKLIGFISTIKKVSILNTPKVGETIITKASLKSRFDSEAYSISTLECVTYIKNKEIASCEMNLFIQEVK